MLKILSACLPIYVYDVIRIAGKKERKKSSTFCIVTHRIRLPAFPTWFLRSALSPSIQDITKHFSVTIYISPAFYNTYFIILSGAFVHMFAELSLPLAMFCCQPCRSRTQHNKPFTIEFTAHSPSFALVVPHSYILHPVGFHFFYHISFTYPISLSLLLSFRITSYNLSVQMRRYIWINEFTSITFFN